MIGYVELFFCGKLEEVRQGRVSFRPWGNISLLLNVFELHRYSRNSEDNYAVMN